MVPHAGTLLQAGFQALGNGLPIRPCEVRKVRLGMALQVLGEHARRREQANDSRRKGITLHGKARSPPGPA